MVSVGYPPILRILAVLMGSWLLLLLAQTSLIATECRANRKKLGLASFVLAAAIVMIRFIREQNIFIIVF